MSTLPTPPTMTKAQTAARKLIGWPLFHLLTGFEYMLCQKPDPAKWSTAEHVVTQWRWWPVPPADDVDLPRVRDRVTETRPLDWPALFDGRRLTWGPMRPGRDGVMSGTPIQQGGPDTRSLTWGYAGWGRQERTRIPIPEVGWWWLRGHPRPSFDEHTTIVAPDGDVHELIKFDPTAPPGGPPFPNQALSWALWRDGELVDGNAMTAARLPQHVFCRRALEHGHQSAVVLTDYVGGDGELTEGPVCGMWVALDRDSDSFRRMTALGGECAAVAEDLATFGARVIDRTGGPCRLQRQAGNQWNATNAHLLDIDVHDLVEVVV